MSQPVAKNDPEIKRPEEETDKKKVALQGVILERCVTGINKGKQGKQGDSGRQGHPETLL